MHASQEVKAALLAARTQLFSRCLTQIDGMGNWETKIDAITLYASIPRSEDLFYCVELRCTPNRVTFYDMSIFPERVTMARLMSRGIGEGAETYYSAEWSSGISGLALELIKTSLPDREYISATRIPETHWRIFQAWVSLRELVNGNQERPGNYEGIRDRVTAKVARLNKECFRTEASLRAMGPSLLKV